MIKLKQVSGKKIVSTFLKNNMVNKFYYLNIYFRYMRGILKNYYEIDQMNIDIKKELNKVLSSTTTPETLLIASLIGVIVWFVLVSIGNLFFKSLNIFTLGVFVFVVIVLCITYWTVFIPARKLSKFLASVEREIEVIKKTNELLPNLFDNL